jgi:hypothetical protein
VDGRNAEKGVKSPFISQFSLIMDFIKNFIPELLDEFNSPSGLALLFLVGLSLSGNSDLISTISLLGIVFFGAIKGVIENISSEMEDVKKEKRLRETYEILLNKRKGSIMDRTGFIVAMTSGLILLIIELYVLFLGASIWLTEGLIINQALSVAWILFVLKYFKIFLDASQSQAFREFVVKSNQELPGKTFWKSDDKG